MPKSPSIFNGKTPHIIILSIKKPIQPVMIAFFIQKRVLRLRNAPHTAISPVTLITPIALIILIIPIFPIALKKIGWGYIAD